jgi:hypothetical protein
MYHHGVANRERVEWNLHLYSPLLHHPNKAWLFRENSNQAFSGVIFSFDNKFFLHVNQKVGNIEEKIIAQSQATGDAHSVFSSSFSLVEGPI